MCPPAACQCLTLSFLVAIRYLDVVGAPPEETSTDPVNEGTDVNGYSLALPTNISRSGSTQSNRRFSTYDLTGSNMIGKGKVPHLSTLPRPNPEAWQLDNAVPPSHPTAYGYATVTPHPQGPLSPALSSGPPTPPSPLPGYAGLATSTPAVHVSSANDTLPGAVVEQSDEEDTYL
mmetsp:Transcript_523/g.1489  ORF Transcript_523/g.1489 Transcript_523/m.1489 type:complete len:175 (+) Transcript_523:108-632(+)